MFATPHGMRAWVLIHTNPHHDLSGIYSNVDILLRAPANVILKSPKVDNNIARFKFPFKVKSYFPTLHSYTGLMFLTYYI